MKLSNTTFIFISFISNFMFGQVSDNLKVNKKSVLQVFKSSIEQDKGNRIRITSNPWSTDSTKYLKSDTIKFINRSNKINEKYCKIINWTFYRKDKFVRSYGEYCKEPPTEKVTTQNDYFALTIEEVDGKVVMKLYNQENLTEKFEIISLTKSQTLSYKNEITYSLTLKRLN